MLFNYKKLVITALAAASLAAVGCKKDYLETTPTNQMSVGDLFQTTKAAYTLLNGMHNFITAPQAAGMTNAADWAQKAQDLGHDAMGADMVLTSSQYDWFIYYYQYVATEAANYWMPYNSWSYYYKLINNANTLIANIDAAAGPEAEKQDIKGQALAYRAWAYFRLVNDFCENYNSGAFSTAKGVPLMLEPTDISTTPKGRGTAQEVYDQIIVDIKESVRLLNLTSVGRGGNKSRINADVAYGIYARIALTMRDYENAALFAELARTNYPLMEAKDLTAGFNSSRNQEWMWASALTAEQSNARRLFNFMSWMDIEGPGYAQVGATRAITKDLYYKMDSLDVRRGQFYDTLAPNGRKLVQNKFNLVIKEVFDYNDLFMRASEMYLIQIEALASLDPNDGNAISLLEELMEIRQPGYTLAATGRTLLDETKLQRRIELWGEGFALDDIKRWQIPLTRVEGRFNHSRGIAQVLTLPANDRKFLFKIPQREMDANPMMSAADQN